MSYWIESHQSLLTHRKTIRCANLLKVNKYQLIGHLHALWWWGLDNAGDHGELGETFAEEIAEAAGFTAKRADEFLKALVFVKFIDETDAGYALHDWWNYAGKLNAKRAKDRARKAETPAISNGTPPEIPRKSQVPNQQHQPVPSELPNPTDLTPPTADAVASAFAKFGKVTSGTPQAIDYAIKDFGLDWVHRAVRVASGASYDGLPGWNYIESILERWKAEGGPDDDKPKPRLQTVGRANGRSQGSDADADLVRGWEEYAAYQN